MHWFTRDWGFEAIEEEQDRIWAEYSEHLRRLIPEMPLPLAEFTQRRERLSVHDALIQRVMISREDRRIDVELLQGDDPPAGYGMLTLTFDDADFVRSNPEELERWVTSHDTDLLWEEIDRVGGAEPAIASDRWEAGFLLGPMESSRSGSRVFDTIGEQSTSLEVALRVPTGWCTTA
jgi:hypothetical protein